jgi:hypothetical protein
MFAVLADGVKTLFGAVPENAPPEVALVEIVRVLCCPNIFTLAKNKNTNSASLLSILGAIVKDKNSFTALVEL